MFVSQCVHYWWLTLAGQEAPGSAIVTELANISRAAVNLSLVFFPPLVKR